MIDVAPRSMLWALRALMVGLAPALAFAVDGALDERASVAGTVATAAWGIVVAAVLVALVAPSPLGLTVTRTTLPLLVPGATVALVMGAAPAWGVAALTLALLATLVAFTAETAEAFVQAAAYGDEQRLPLRPPAALLVPMVLSWVLWCALALGAVLALSAAAWLLGGALAVVAVILAVPLFARFHRFSRRWLVLVPAGVVLHDHVVLGETLLLMRPNVALARLAPATTEAADFTGPAAGHAVELTVREMVLALLAATPTDPKGKALHVQSLLVAPSRPGRALKALATAKVPVG
jgi:hypothetical protein